MVNVFGSMRIGTTFQYSGNKIELLLRWCFLLLLSVHGCKTNGRNVTIQSTKLDCIYIYKSIDTDEWVTHAHCFAIRVRVWHFSRPWINQIYSVICLDAVVSLLFQHPDLSRLFSSASEKTEFSSRYNEHHVVENQLFCQICINIQK